MRCLTSTESEAWFTDIGVEIDRYGYISFSRRATKRRCIFLPNVVLDASNLGRLSTELVDWLPNGCERMLWLTNWSTYQPDPTILFETIRRGRNENRHIIDAPGHLFESSAYDRDDYDTRTKQDHEENTLMWGFLLLIIALQLGGYLIAPNGDCIEVDDTSIAISSTDDAKIRDAYALANRFGLEFRE
jgi:hypothetical protein